MCDGGEAAKKSTAHQGRHAHLRCHEIHISHWNLVKVAAKGHQSQDKEGRASIQTHARLWQVCRIR